MVNVAEFDDFTSRVGIDKAKAGLVGPCDALWNSAPCTGGSVLQSLNIHLYGERAIKKIKGHYKLFRKLWTSFEEVAEHAIALGAAVFLEWPRYNRYWKEKRVQRFLSKHGFQDCMFDGCVYGLVAKHGVNQGMPIRKPWRVACVNSCLPGFLNKLCDGSHEHCPCEGSNTRPTQAYTKQIAEVVHNALAHDVRIKLSNGLMKKVFKDLYTKASPAITHVYPCLLYTSDAADE